MILFLILVILVLFIVISWVGVLRDTKRINVKGPVPVPILGNAHLFIDKSSEFLNLLKKFSNIYGDPFRVHFFTTPYVILSHPKQIELLVSNPELITKGRSYSFLLPWLGQGLLTASGQRWRTHRKLLTPAFHYNMLHNFLPVFCKNQNVLTQKLQALADGRPINLFPIIALAALDNVTESIMGVSMNTQMDNKPEYVKAIEDLAIIISMKTQIPILAQDIIFNWLPQKKIQDNAIKYLHEFTDKMITIRRDQLNKANITGLNGSCDVGIRNKYAFLDLLLLSKVDGKPIDSKRVREEVDTFMFEGHDTTTSGVVCALYCLSKHKKVQEKIFEEQKRIVGDDIHRDPTYTELQQMKYLDMVIRESMRLYPPVPLIERRITRDFEVGELKLVKGTCALINIFQAHRQPDFFEDPLEFRPERFESPLKNPISWLAFSAGPRNCIGQKFAMMSLKVIVSAIIKNFILLPADEEPVFTADLVLRSTNGVHVKLIPRT